MKRFLIFPAIIILLFFGCLFQEALIDFAIAQNTTRRINIKVGLSVCGNGIIEGSEDCEGANLNGKTCLSLGYQGGRLTCDVSCAFVTFSCLRYPTPTQKPAATTTPLPAPTAPISAPTSAPKTPVPTANNLMINPIFRQLVNPTAVASSKPINKSAVPSLVIINETSKIAEVKIQRSVESWVKGWKTTVNAAPTKIPKKTAKSKKPKCDLNNDGKCTIKDFSILLNKLKSK